MTNVLALGEFDLTAKADLVLKRNPIRTRPYESRVAVDFDAIDSAVSSLDRDLAYIVASLFAYEGLRRNEEVESAESIHFLVKDVKTWNTSNVKPLLQSIVSLSLREEPLISFQGPRISPLFAGSSIPHVDLVSLFSGGIDSLCGLLGARTVGKSVAGLFVSHAKLQNTVRRLSETQLEPMGISMYVVRTQRGRVGMQQLRGFLYLCFGAILAKLSDAEGILVSETGPTMFLPEIFPLDEITLTTHPTLVKLSKMLLKEIYGRDLKFYEPYANITKAEAVAPYSKMSATAQTHSCITTRYSDFAISHCGKCLGCLVRKISCLVAGVPDAKYAWDLLAMNIGEEVNGRQRNAHVRVSDYENLFALTSFSRAILEDRLPHYTGFKIEQFGKRELFERFALDVLSAIFLLYGHGKSGRNTYLSKFYMECRDDGIIVEERLENRIAEVRARKYNADFDYFM